MSNSPKDKAAKAITAENIKKYQEERQGLEVDLLDEVLKSRSIAWKVAGGFFVLALAASLATGIVVHRYSQPLPTNLMVAQTDGQYTRLTLMPERASLDAELDMYWASQYVVHYETYDYYNAQVHYDAIGLMSDPSVADAWRKANYSGESALDKVYGDSQMKRVTINSRTVNTKAGIATIRYSTQIKYKNRPLPDPPKHFIATVAYNYNKQLMTAAQRDINPTGFQVMSIDIHEESLGNGAR